jgi:phosphate-selective porin OprO/OprP
MALVVMAICISGPAIAKNEIIVLRNVVLLDRETEDSESDVLISIRVDRGKLDLVSADPISVEDATLALDARGGVLLGSLTIGEPANFVILDKNPRDDFSVILDTNRHVRFAMQDGKVVRNRLSRHVGPILSAGEPSEKRRSRPIGTRAPVALPINYGKKHRWNAWELGWTTGGFLAALVLDRQDWVSQDAATEAQVGNLNDYSSGEIRGLRFGTVGTINFDRPWVYTFFGATNAYDRGFDTESADGVSWFDYRLDMPFAHWATLSVGKQKEPISFERSMTLINQPMMERSVVGDGLLPARNTGIVFSGTNGSQRMTWSGGVFNNWLEEGRAFKNSATQYVARLTGLPALSVGEDNLLHVGAGVRYSDAKDGLQFVTEPEVDNAPVFVDTDKFDADANLTWNLESSWRSGRLWLVGEYTQAHIQGPDMDDPVLGGYYVAGTWALTGEVRDYHKRFGITGSMPVARPVDRGGWGAWELALRWSDLNLDDGAIEGGRVQVVSAGVNWWLLPSASVNINYRHVILDRFDETGHSDSITTRVLLMLN